MNHAMKAAFVGPPAAFAGPHAASRPFRAVSSFHSTPSLERKRRTHWNIGTSSFSSKRFNNYAKRTRRMESKRTLLRDISEFAEHLFESWRDEDDRNNSSSRDGNSWFRRQYWSKGARLNGFGSQESHWGRYNNKRKGGCEFYLSDDDDVETIFRSAFEGKQYHYWSSHGSENFHWRNSYGQTNHRSSWYWKYQTDEETDTYEETDAFPQSHLVSERLVLGLSASGPLKLGEVKSAYRACALRWHPDRHQGSSKVAAEEKFKHCSAAYKSLCERLTMD